MLPCHLATSLGHAVRQVRPIAPSLEAHMKRRSFVVTTALGSLAAGTAHFPLSGVTSALADMNPEPSPRAATRKILIAGGGYGTAFIRYMASLTGKPRPRLCY